MREYIVNFVRIQRYIPKLLSEAMTADAHTHTHPHTYKRTNNNNGVHYSLYEIWNDNMGFSKLLRKRENNLRFVSSSRLEDGVSAARRSR